MCNKRRKMLWLVLLPLAFPAWGQDQQATEIEILRSELTQLRADYEQRIENLEQRLNAAEHKAEQAALEASQATLAARELQTVPTAVPERTGAVASNAFNPALGVIFQGQAWAYDKDPESYYIPGFPLGGEAGLAPQGLALAETEININANVDDKFTAHTGGDIGFSNSWLFGLSWLHASSEGRESGSEDEPLLFNGDTDILIADFVWKWAPNGNSRQRNFIVQAEYMLRKEDGDYTLSDTLPLPWDTDQQGWYAQAIYQPWPRWRIGARIERLSSDTPGPSFAGSVLDPMGKNPSRYSLMVDWSNSEFSRLRLQYNRDKSGLDKDHQFALQYIYSIGAQLEIGWLPMLLTKANNPEVRPGGAGYLEAGAFVRHLEIPASVDRSQGDVHPQGNPHIQTDPRNFLLVASALSERLARLDPDHAEDYQAKLDQFLTAWNAALVKWETEARPLRGKRVVTHHKSWVYLENWLGLELVGTLEPVPGIPPTASHLSKLLTQLGDDGSGADFIIRSPFQSDKASEWLSERTAIPELVLPFTVGGSEQAGDLYGLFSDTIKRLLEVSQ